MSVQRRKRTRRPIPVKLTGRNPKPYKRDVKLDPKTIRIRFIRNTSEKCIRRYADRIRTLFTYNSFKRDLHTFFNSFSRQQHSGVRNATFQHRWEQILKNNAMFFTIPPLGVSVPNSIPHKNVSNVSHNVWHAIDDSAPDVSRQPRPLARNESASTIVV